jgi:hypothetical protein
MSELVFIVSVSEDVNPEDIEKLLDSHGYPVVTWDFADSSSL